MDESRSSTAARARSEPRSPDWTPPVTVPSLRRSARPSDPHRRSRCDLALCPGRQRRIGAVARPGVHPRNGGTALGRIVFITSDTFWAPPAPALLAYIARKGAAGYYAHIEVISAK